MASAPPAPAETTALPEAAPRWQDSALAHGLGVITLLCSGVALLLTVLFGGLASKLVYSFSIGLSCWAVVTLLSSAVEAGRRRLGQDAGAPIGWAVRILVVLSGSLIGGSVGLWTADTLTGLESEPLWDWRSRGSQITLAVTLLAASVATVVMTLRERLAQARARAAAAQRLAAETQLRLLQSQLEPHMLFNTLANLRVLIGLDPVRAQAMLDRLIAFLRATLSASRVGHHPLADEFARVADYLALMEVRMGARLRSRLLLPPELSALPVPPLLLQPLIENAIKHGLEPQVAGGRLEVRARRDGDRLRLTVRDTGVGLAQTAAGGTGSGTHFGLQQVRERLAALYGDRAALQLQAAPDAEGGALATIELPVTA